jgi:hypothetical protein
MKRSVSRMPHVPSGSNRRRRRRNAFPIEIVVHYTSSTSSHIFIPSYSAKFPCPNTRVVWPVDIKNFLGYAAPWRDLSFRCYSVSLGTLWTPVVFYKICLFWVFVPYYLVYNKHVREYNPHFLDLSTSWRWVVSLMPGRFTPARKEPPVPIG